ncbi:MAG: FHA domain-containing protein [Actinobacteria bacterium]|nr:FHA domain-containing protein [Actinomycetota bacterium]
MSSRAVSSVAVEEALLILKIAFLFLLYLFIWRIVRTASRDLRLPQESMVLPPHQARALIGRPSVPSGRLVVLASPAVEVGTEQVLDSAPLTVGRGSQNDVPLDRDDFASGRHARFEPRRDGVWVEDVGSTNGTYVNGARLSQARRLRPGDVVRIGQTDLRFEQ